MKFSRTKLLLLLTFFTVLAYGNTIRNNFVWDDDILVTENSHIRSFRCLPTAIYSDLFHTHNTQGALYYRPTQTVAYILDYELGGVNPAGYHCTNLLLHLACVLLLALLIERLSDNRPLSFAVAALFAVHPVLANAVAYVAGRADPLAFAGMLAAWLLWMRRRPLAFAAAALCYLFALGSRENAFLFPALIFLHSLILDRNRLRRAALDALPFVLLAVAFGFWRSAVLSLHGTSAVNHWTLPWLTRLQLPFRALATYLGLLVWPAHLQMERQVVLGPPARLLALTGIGVLATAALVALGVRAARRDNRLALFGLLWFAVTLLPVSGLFSLNATVAEHWLYVPCVGLFLALGAHCRFNRAAAVVGLLVLLALAGRTVARNRDWHDATTLFTQTRAAAPYSTAARANLSRALASSGDDKRALGELLDVQRVAPGDVHAHNNLAAFWLRRGDLARAEAETDAALRIAPGNVSALLRLADLHEQRGASLTNQTARLRETLAARVCYTASLARSLNTKLRLEYGQFLLRQHRAAEALPIADEACALEPCNAEAHNLRGVVLAEMNWLAEAKTEFEAAQRYDRHSGNAARNLARLDEMFRKCSSRGTGFQPVSHSAK